MAICTAITERFDLEYPIVLAPMARISGGALAAAVSNAGGLGLIGGGYGDAAWMRTELDLLRNATDRPWGVGFITWHTSPEVVDLALACRPDVVFLSFGDPCRYAKRVKAAGAVLICQVQDVPAAVEAVAAGADIIVAQGTEAGGHGAQRALLPLLPAVVDAVAPVPVLAAGGIADGRGLAATIVLGAQGAVIGTRFLASVESLFHPDGKQRIVMARGSDAARTRVFDIVRGYAWPRQFTVRALRNDYLEHWSGREAELEAVADMEMPRYATAMERGDFEIAGVFAGENVDLIESIEPAAALVRSIGSSAEATLLGGTEFVTTRDPG
jgi:nitronate monooxygenase